MENSTDLEKRLLDLEQRVLAVESELKGPVTLAQERKKVLSEKEYLLEKNPKSTVEKTLFLGAHLEEHKGMGSFTIKDLRAAFRAAREPAPANINDMVNKNIQKGYFMETTAKDDKKTWMLTSTGEKTVIGEFHNK
jgi:hypothetical protein